MHFSTILFTHNFIHPYLFKLTHLILTAKRYPSQAPVVHTYNPSYSGGRDQEDHGLKPAPDKQFSRSHLKNTQHKAGLMEWLKQ
jgi:hypothetical protein